MPCPARRPVQHRHIEVHAKSVRHQAGQTPRSRPPRPTILGVDELADIERRCDDLWARYEDLVKDGVWTDEAERVWGEFAVLRIEALRLHATVEKPRVSLPANWLVLLP